MASIIDDAEAIARRLRQIKEEESPPDPERIVMQASGESLDYLARLFLVEQRQPGESDASFRGRVLDSMRMTSSAERV